MDTDRPLACRSRVGREVSWWLNGQQTGTNDKSSTPLLRDAQLVGVVIRAAELHT